MAYIQSKGTLVAGITDFAPMETISCASPYLSNAQVVVMYEEELKQYEAREECQHLLFAVEVGSTVIDIIMSADACIQAVYKDGSINTLAKKYGIGNAVL